MTATEGDTLILITPRDLKLGSNDVHRLFLENEFLDGNAATRWKAVGLRVEASCELSPISSVADQTEHVAYAVACCRDCKTFGWHSQCI